MSLARARGWILPLLLAAALGAQTVRAWRRAEATHLVYEVERRTLALARQETPNDRELRRNLVLLDRAAPLFPSLVAIPIARGSQFLLLGKPTEAIAAYQQALALEPRAETYFNLGRVYLEVGDRDAARHHFDLAVRATPRLKRDVRQLLR